MRSRAGVIARGIAAGLLIVIGSVTLSAALPSLWFQRTILDTEQWLATVEPLARDQEVRDAVAEAATEAILANADVRGQTEGALPPQLDALTAPISVAIERFVRDVVWDTTHSDRFVEIWLALNQRIHEGLLRALRGESGVVTITDGTLAVDTNVLLAEVTPRLDPSVQRVVELLPASEEASPVVLFRSDALSIASRAVQTLDRWPPLLGRIAIALFAAAVLVAEDRRRALLFVGVGALVAGLGQLWSLSLLQESMVSSAGRWGEPLRLVFEALTQDLVVSLRLTALAGLVIWFGAVIVGPSSVGMLVRRNMRRATRGLADSDWDSGRTGAWLAENMATAAGVALAIGAVVLLTASLRMPLVAVWVIGAEVVVLFVMWLLARAAPHQ